MIALRDWDVAVVELTGGLAIHVEPPVTLEDGLVEQSGLWTEEALHHQAVVCECTYVKHLQNSTCKSLDKSSLFIINCHYKLTNINSLITILLKNLSTEICIVYTIQASLNIITPFLVDEIIYVESSEEFVLSLAYLTLTVPVLPKES